MRKFLHIVILTLFVLSCNSNDDVLACNTMNPTENLTWIKSKINEMKEFSGYKYQYILKSDYNKETVFIFADCCPTCNSIYTVYNCNGDFLGSIGGEGVPISVFNNGILIWKSENNECSF